VPYPVQLLGTEVMQEFIGEADGTAAPRLAETRPEPAELAGLWRQLVRALSTLAGLGLAHGDLSAYNLLVHRGRLIMIDLPQVVDVIANPRGAEFLERDAANVARWFTARGLTADLGAGARGRSSGDPGRPGGGAGRTGSVPGEWAEVPAPEDLGFFLLREARLV
jgi:RIO kinase 1